MEMNRQNIKSEINRLENKLTVDMSRLSNLNKRHVSELNILFDKLSKQFYSNENIDIEDGRVYVYDLKKERYEWNRIRLIHFYFNATSYELNTEYNRFLSPNNTEEFLYKNTIISDFATALYENKEYILKCRKVVDDRYIFIFNILDVPGTMQLLEDYKIKLKRLEEDLLLEVGNVYFNGNMYYEILQYNVDITYESYRLFDNLKQSSTVTVNDRGWFLRNLKGWTPTKATERNIKLKRLLDV